MLDGTYRIKVDTPLGSKNGTVILRTEGNTVFANVDAPIVGKQTARGHADGDTFTGQGSMKIMLVGAVNYTLSGNVSGNDLVVRIQSNKGTFTLRGTRV